jgi:zinc protease
VVSSVVPKGQRNLIAGADNAGRPQAPANFKNDISEYQNLKYIKGKDNFDRSKRPAPGPNPVVKVPEFWSLKSDNGLEFIGTPYNELPLTNITVYVKAGQIRETEDKAGTAYLLANLMSESTLNFTAEEISAKLEMLGSSLDISSSREDIIISVTALNKKLDATLELMNEVMFRPRFSQVEFDRLKAEQTQALKNRTVQASTLANDIFRRIMLPTGAVGLPEPGTEASIANISLADVRSFYSNWFTPENAKVTIVGSITESEVKTKLGFLQSWEKGNAGPPQKASAAKGNGRTIYFVDKPGAAQGEIRIGWPSIYYDALGEYYTAGVMNYPLGGAFNSRINLNLREKNGWTYGARAGFASTEYVNVYVGSAGVKLEATDSALSEFVREIKEFRKNGLKAEELAFAQSAISQSEALKYETPDQKSRFLKLIMDNGYDKDLSAKRNKIAAKLSLAEANELARKLLNTDEMVIVVVGDKAKLADKLKALDYEFKEVPAGVDGLQEILNNK